MMWCELKVCTRVNFEWLDGPPFALVSSFKKKESNILHSDFVKDNLRFALEARRSAAELRTLLNDYSRTCRKINNATKDSKSEMQ